MRVTTRLAMATIIPLLISGCGTGTDETDRSMHDASKNDRMVATVQESSPWGIHQITGWEVESYGSLRGQTASADLVAVGTVVDAKPGRIWVESEGQETMTSEMTEYTVELREILAGKPVGPSSDQITLEFGPSAPTSAGERNAMLGTTSLFILRRKGASIPAIGRLSTMKDEYAREVYRVVNSTGLIDEVGGEAVLPLGQTDQAWSKELDKGTFAEAVRQVRVALAQGS